MTFEVQQTRWDRIIRRVSGSIGPGSRVSETLSELFPVLDIERVPGELLILGGTHLCFGGGALTAAAGESPLVQLFNPANSNTVATVSSVQVSSTTIVNFRWGRTAIAAGAGIGTEVFRDSRLPLTARPVCNVIASSQVALATGSNQLRLIAGTPVILDDENGVIVLGPDSGLEMGFSQQASIITWSFSWRERPAEQSELSL